MGIHIQERTRQEIEAKLLKMGDYVKMDYLQRALTSGLDFETKKFVMVSLSRLYENKGMHLEAARLLRNASEINTTFKGKISDFMKSIELYVKAGGYSDADFVFAQALALTADHEKVGLKSTYRKLYLDSARFFLKGDKRTQARKAYEKALSLDLEVGERRQVQQELLSLYEKLGCINEYYRLKNSMGGLPSYQ
jgi:tetratricopeptide (TPR) repeat protein